MQSIIYPVLIIIIMCSGCQQQPDDAWIKDAPHLSQLNIENWDKQSQQIINSALEKNFDKLIYIQIKHLIEILIAHQHPDYALTFFDQLPKKKSQYMHFLMAKAYYDNTQVRQALAVLDMLPKETSNPSISHLTFKILLELGRADQITTLHQTNPDIFDNVLSIYYVAMAYLDSRQCEQAIPLFLQVLEKQPTANSINSPLASAYQQCQQPIQAQTTRSHIGPQPLSNTHDFPNRLMKNGNPGLYYKQLLNQALTAQDLKTVVEMTEKLISLNTADNKMLTNLAIIRFKSGQVEQANAAIKLALQQDHDHIKSLELMYEFNKITNKQLATQAIDKLITLAPDNTTYQNARALLITSNPSP